ncbi:MAG: hypothetical protein AAGA03_01330 [Planctomycetota bacterium]
MSKPIETITVPNGNGGTLTAAVWGNQAEQDGKSYTRYSVTLEKRYRDGDQWKSAKSFNANELLSVAYLANQAYEKALTLRSQANSNAG